MGAKRFYQYSPLLHIRCFRVVHLLSVQTTYLPWPRTVIHVEISQVDASSPPDYNALSYAWNVSPDQDPDRVVFVHDGTSERELLIHNPLHEALVHLLNQGLGSLPIFVDQICINQDDPQERALQVRLMREVYTNCLRTIVWLGPGNRQTDRYADYVTELCATGVLNRLLLQQGPFVGAVFDAVQYPDSECDGAVRAERDEVLALVTQRGHAFPRDGILDMFGRGWWDRLWIIQEVCLSPLVTFVCGTRALCFDCLRCGLLYFTMYNNWWLTNEHTSSSRSEIRQREQILDVMPRLFKLFQERKAIRTLGVRRTTYDLLLKYNINDWGPKIGATYQEDRFFGLLGMAADGDAWAQISHGRDYVRVYTEVAAQMARQNLDVLILAQSENRAAGLPSWVPDWSTNLQVPNGYQNLNTPVFSAGGNAPGAVTDVQNGVLSVQGYIVGHVTDIGQHAARIQVDGQTERLLEYSSAQELFNDLHRLLTKSAAMPDSPLAEAAATKEGQAQVIMHMADFGLTRTQLLDEHGGDGQEQILASMYELISTLGQRILNTQHLVESYRVSRLVGTLGALPWYWLPPGEVQVFRSCALHPRLAWRAGFEAGFLFATDVLGVLLSSVIVRSFARWIRLRKRWQRVELNTQGQDEDRRKLGLDPAVMRSRELNWFLDSMVKCAGTKGYMLQDGRVGMGPAGMRLGDVVVVLEGSTMPHVLRPRTDAQGVVVRDGYEYVGEAFCYGVMNGEMMTGGGVARKIDLY